VFYFFFQAEDGIRDFHVTGVQTCALPIYDSKAFAEYMIGWMYELARQPALAREAYDRVIAEDLSFYMAHLRLGELARIRGDTAKIGRASCRERGEIPAGSEDRNRKTEETE